MKIKHIDNKSFEIENKTFNKKRGRPKKGVIILINKTYNYYKSIIFLFLQIDRFNLKSLDLYCIKRKNFQRIF